MIKKYFTLIMIIMMMMLMIILAIWVSNRLLQQLDQKIPDVGLSEHVEEHHGPSVESFESMTKNFPS